MKHPIEKMRSCLALLPPPGGEVVAECLDEIELLRQQVTLLRDALKQSRHMIYYGEPQIGWNITRIDEVIEATKEK